MNKRYVFNYIPIDSILYLLVETVLLIRLFFIYTNLFASRPILTTMVANAILTGVSDTFAQTLTIIRDRARNMDHDKEARIDAIREQYDLAPQAGLEMLRGAERAFDSERLARFVGYGFLSAVVQFKWFACLDDTFPIAGHSALLKRLLADQLLYAPYSLIQFFAFMNVMEGNTMNDLKARLRKQFMGALKAQYILWPAVQVINFKFVPLMYQLPVVSSISVGWNIYLSVILGRK